MQATRLLLIIMAVATLVHATIDEILKFGREIEQIVQIKQIQSQNDEVNIYVIDSGNSSSSTPQSFLKRANLPPLSMLTVSGLNYAYPFQEIGMIKRHFAALNHCVFHGNKRACIIIEDRIKFKKEMSVDLIKSFNSLDLHIVHFPTTSPKYAALPFRSLTMQGTDFGHMYMVSREFAWQTMLLPTLSSSANLENSLAMESKYEFGSSLLQSMQQLNDSKIMVFDNMVEFERPQISFDLDDLSVHIGIDDEAELKLRSYSSDEKVKAIFLISLGQTYSQNINWNSLVKYVQLLNPTYDIFVLFDQEAEAFLSKKFPEYLEMFKIMPLPQWRSDLLRYLLLYEYGGVYLDLDLKFLIGVDELWQKINNQNIRYVMIRGGGRENEIANGFIIAPPRDRLFLNLAEAINSLVEVPKDYGFNVRHMYSAIVDKYGSVQHVGAREDLYMLKEVCINAEDFRFVIFFESEVISYSNGKKNWPPKHGETLFMST